MQGVSQRFMICEHVKVTSFNEVSEVFHGQIHCEEFTVESAIPHFGWLGEVSNWMPVTVNELLQNSNVRSICHDAGGCIQFGVC